MLFEKNGVMKYKTVLYCLSVDEGCSTGRNPVLIYYRNAYKQISHDWGTAHINDAAEK